VPCRVEVQTDVLLWLTVLDSRSELHGMRAGGPKIVNLEIQCGQSRRRLSLRGYQPGKPPAEARPDHRPLHAIVGPATVRLRFA